MGDGLQPFGGARKGPVRVAIWGIQRAAITTLSQRHRKIGLLHHHSRLASGRQTVIPRRRTTRGPPSALRLPRSAAHGELGEKVRLEMGCHRQRRPRLASTMSGRVYLPYATLQNGLNVVHWWQHTGPGRRTEILMSSFERPEHPEHTEQAPARRPVRKSVPAPSYDQERAADSPADRRAQRYRAEMTLRHFASERAARQAVQGEPAGADAPVSLPPTSTLARRLQERPGEATAATLMRQFEAKRAAREAEADASPPPIPLRHRSPVADGVTGPVTPADAPMATPQRQDEERGTHGEHAAEGVPPPRLPATGPAVVAPAP